MPHCNANNDDWGRDINKESKDSTITPVLQAFSCKPNARPAAPAVV